MSSLKKLGEIARGYSKLMLQKLELTSDEQREMSQNRLKICREGFNGKKCPFMRDFEVCGKCGCYLPAKTQDKYSECPEKHW